MMKNILKTAVIVSLLCFGTFMFIYGEFDDSPGAQLIGCLLAAVGTWKVFKLVKGN